MILTTDMWPILIIFFFFLEKIWFDLIFCADSGRLVTDELKYVSRAVAMDNLTSIVSNLAEIRLNLAAIERDTGLLQDNARELQVPPSTRGPNHLSF